MSRVSELIDRARRAAALEDFGAESFREGLEILVASADSQARLNDQGRAMFDAEVVGYLCRRLEIEHWYGLHPEIDDEEIAAPLIGLGLPRTGSTALHCTLAEDPGVRYIRNWEHNAPCPPPETATEHTDPRIEQAAARIALTDKLSPRLKAMVPVSPTAAMECHAFMNFDFKSQTFQSHLRIPAYAHWLLHEADLEPTYRYVKRVMKLLQWRCPPKRWRLKSPSHAPYVDIVQKTFPDARFWMTHRPVSAVLPSVVDVYAELSQPYTDELDYAYLRAVNEDYWSVGLRKLIAFRDRGADSRFFDIHFADFQAEPMRVVEQLYAFLGEDLTDEARRRMEAWRLSMPVDKAARQANDAAALGVDIPAMRERFRFYSERFGLEESSPDGR